MDITISTHKYEGIYYGSTRTEAHASSLRELIKHVRAAFEDRVDAVLIERLGVAVAVWLAEPDVDCNLDGFYEVEGRYPGDEYVLYRESDPAFSRYLYYHFPKYAKRLSEATKKRLAIV
jgi:hypothetical protein